MSDGIFSGGFYGEGKYGLVLYDALVFIFDRSKEDIAKKTDKAYLDWRHLSRIGKNIVTVDKVACASGYDAPIGILPNPGGLWYRENAFVEGQVIRYVVAINDVLKKIGLPQRVQYASNLTYQIINEWEFALRTACTHLESAAHQWRYSGTLISGEQVI